MASTEPTSEPTASFPEMNLAESWLRRHPDLRLAFHAIPGTDFDPPRATRFACSVASRLTFVLLASTVADSLDEALRGVLDRIEEMRDSGSPS